MFWLLIICTIFMLLIISSADKKSISIRDLRSEISDEYDNFALLIQDAINNNRKIKIVYKSSNIHDSGEITSRIIKPIELQYGKNISNNELIKKSPYAGDFLYLRAYCELRNEERHFRLDRILSLEIV